MDRKWSLKELYTSFQDEDFLNDLKQIELILTDMKKYPACMQTEDNLVAYLKQENILDDLVEKVYAFISLIMNADTNNLDALKYASVIENLLASFADTSAKIQKWIAKFDLSKIDNEDIKNHLFVLNEINNKINTC